MRSLRWAIYLWPGLADLWRTGRLVGTGPGAAFALLTV